MRHIHYMKELVASDVILMIMSYTSNNKLLVLIIIYTVTFMVSFHRLINYRREAFLLQKLQDLCFIVSLEYNRVTCQYEKGGFDIVADYGILIFVFTSISSWSELDYPV
jgi:hypothetical protein